MAKKKGKKSVPKQVEAVSPPDHVEPAAAPVINEPNLNEAAESPVQPIDAKIDPALIEDSSLALDRNHERPGEASFDVSTLLEDDHRFVDAAPKRKEEGTTSISKSEQTAFIEGTDPSVSQRIPSPIAVQEETSHMVTESQTVSSNVPDVPVPSDSGVTPEDQANDEPRENHAARQLPEEPIHEEASPPATTEDHMEFVSFPDVEPDSFAAASEDTSDMIVPVGMETFPLKHDEIPENSTTVPVTPPLEIFDSPPAASDFIKNDRMDEVIRETPISHDVLPRRKSVHFKDEPHQIDGPLVATAAPLHSEMRSEEQLDPLSMRFEEKQQEDPQPAFVPEPSTHNESPTSAAVATSIQEQGAPQPPNAGPNLEKKETAKQRRKREAEERVQRGEQEKIVQENLEQERLQQEQSMQEQHQRDLSEKRRSEEDRLQQHDLARKELEIKRVEKLRLEQELLDQKEIEWERLQQEQLARDRLEQEKLEEQRLEQDRLKQEELAREKIELVRMEKHRLEQEELTRREAEQDALEQQRLQQERLEQTRIAEGKIEQARLNERRAKQDRLEKELLEQKKLEEERLARERLEVERAERARIEAKRIRQARLEAELLEEERREEELQEQKRFAIERLEQQRQEQLAQTAAAKAQEEAQAAEDARLSAERDSLTIAKDETMIPRPHAIDRTNTAVPEASQWSTPPASISEPDVPTSTQDTGLIHHLPTPATSVDRSNSPHSSVATDAPEPSAHVPKYAPQAAATSKFIDLGQVAEGRYRKDSSASPVAKHQVVSTLVEESRPAAPSPPVGKLRLRHTSAFDSEDDSDSALVYSRRPFRGGEDSLSGARASGQGYPPQPTHHRSVFASRVPPVEPSYPEPPPTQPPGYNHPRHYASAAPPYFPNHGYGMSQSGYQHPNAYGPPPQSSSLPYAEPWNYAGPPQRHDTLVTRDYSMGLAPISSGAGIEDGSSDVFSRIAQAIPDLHVLLARYKETHGQLSVREESLRRAGVEQEEKLKAKDNEIDELKERARNLEIKHSMEANRLRLQVGNSEEQARELQEQRAETEKAKREAASLDATMKSWEAKYKELEIAHATVQRTSTEEQAKAWNDFEEWKSTTTTRNDAEKIALAIQFDKMLKDADVLAENRRQEVAATHLIEKDNLTLDYQRHQRECEASFEKSRNELEMQLEALRKDHEGALTRERESRETWLVEHETLNRSHHEDRESLRQAWDEQRELLEAQYRKSKIDINNDWNLLYAEATRKLDEEKTRVELLLKERDDLLNKHSALKAQSEQEKTVIKSIATNLESEKSRLEKLMECYGDIAEIKSKGDTYYSVSFSQLQKQIIDLATTHFVHLPVRPPAEDLAQVPTNLPSFLGDTTASRQVRAAYIAHTVSKLITYRVFGPFLFSLGRRYDKADSLFLSMSNHIRDKSTRKEAIWRQQTLLAAFTSSGAKQRINTAAGTVVEEIVSAIKHFADPREEEGIKSSVKRIVKLAAETWRFARLEREMINATMPALQDEEHEFNGPEYWPSYESYKPDGTLIASLAGTSSPSNIEPRVLLRLFPVIYRESKHENFHGDDEQPDKGCIYHHGLALYDDAEAVIQRTEELRSAGLPPFTTASPTIAENGNKFPPPIVPPPREALPNLPETAESLDRSIMSTSPPTLTDVRNKTSVKQVTTPFVPSTIQTFDESTSLRPSEPYKRPPPGPIDFVSPRDLIGLPLPMEGPRLSETKTPSIVDVQPGPELTQHSHLPPPSHPPPAPPVEEPAEEPLQSTPTESAILPPPFSESSSKDSGARELPTPPLSRSDTPAEQPMSPLFEAIDEIESLQSHRSRHPSVSLSRRRSTHSRRSRDLKESIDTKEDLPEVDPRPEVPDTIRRTSGYALSTRTMKTVDSERTDRTEKTDRTERTDRTDRTERTDKTARDPKSRYLCESRSAAVKGLYPNSPLAGQNASGSSRNSTSSAKKKDCDSKELKHQKSIPDNGTWDTTSTRTSDEANTQMSTD